MNLIVQTEFECIECNYMFTSLLSCVLHHNDSNHKQFLLSGTGLIYNIDNYIDN